MRSLIPICLAAVLAGCRATPEPSARSAGEVPADPPREQNYDDTIADLASEDPAVRDRAEWILEAGQLEAFEACRAALDRGTSDQEQEARLRRIVVSIASMRLRAQWREEQYVIREGGRVIGREIDRAVLHEAAADEGEGETPAHWKLDSIVRMAREGQPTVEVRLQMTCAADALLTPESGVYGAIGNPETLSFTFLSADKVSVTWPHGEPRKLQIRERAVPFILAVNETRVLELASLARRTEMSYRVWSPALGEDPPEHSAKFLSTARVEWGGRTLEVRVYEVRTPSGTDRYEISDDVGLVRARIGELEIEKLPPRR